MLVEGGDRKGLLHDMTGAILRHGGDIHAVEIVERGQRSAVYWGLEGVEAAHRLRRDLQAIDVVARISQLPSMFQVYGKRIIVVGAGAQVGQVALGGIGECGGEYIRGERLSVGTVP